MELIGLWLRADSVAMILRLEWHETRQPRARFAWQCRPNRLREAPKPGERMIGAAVLLFLQATWPLIGRQQSGALIVLRVRLGQG